MTHTEASPNTSMPSYSTRTVYQWTGWKPEKKRFIYEERITVWTARNQSFALRKAEAEATRYAKQNRLRYLGYIELFWMFNELPSNGVEVFSLLRESDLPPARYIRTHFNTGFEKQGSK